MSVDLRPRTGQGWASLAIALLAVVMVVAGLLMAGGPMQARKERRDEARLQDLSDLSQHISCLSRQGDRFTMPTDLAETAECPGPVRLADRTTGAPYRIEPLADGKYRLCAGFELAAKDQPRWAAERRDGDCIVYDLPRPVPVVPGEPAVTIDKVD